MRGIRGAITVQEDTREAIWNAARAMMEAVLERNALAPAAIGAVIFSMTEDLSAAFPTAGVRQIEGFDLVPLFDARQCAVEGSLEKCIRVLVLADTDKAQAEIRHVYMGKAKELRPDIAPPKIIPN
ncbi:chorismate mutase [Mitsuokella sp. oral taxon 131]|uniref:chorismate mutase n=1 Tax=Mitsuokella sp. oral taxon 131 TaxID=1321780 RepID=UPI0003ADE4C6|nr:chorismate mutase [Mitsuokella sp. oral taxon 131]ERL04484.1 chorismate mutase [Mitsuokella sp. oral taxon 131 str. W9106]